MNYGAIFAVSIKPCGVFSDIFKRKSHYKKHAASPLCYRIIMQNGKNSLTLPASGSRFFNTSYPYAQAQYMEPMLRTTPYLYMKMKNTLLLVFALLTGIASAQNLSYSSTCAPRRTTASSTITVRQYLCLCHLNFDKITLLRVKWIGKLI